MIGTCVDPRRRKSHKPLIGPRNAAMPLEHGRFFFKNKNIKKSCCLSRWYCGQLPTCWQGGGNRSRLSLACQWGTAKRLGRYPACRIVHNSTGCFPQGYTFYICFFCFKEF